MPVEDHVRFVPPLNVNIPPKCGVSIEKYGGTDNASSFGEVGDVCDALGQNGRNALLSHIGLLPDARSSYGCLMILSGPLDMDKYGIGCMPDIGVPIT